MSFHYDKHKNGDGHGSVWTAYSDLFLGLSIIFLLLYVTVSLRQGTDGIQQFYENQKLSHENQDLKEQLRVYETLKKDYLNKQASRNEMDSYQELMDQLELLQDKANEEKVSLEQQAQDHAKKERALNKYQQMIRNIINSNMVAKGRIKSRDQVIESQDTEIAENEEEIKDLESTVAEKRAQLALGEKKIRDLDSNLNKRVTQLRNAYKANKMTQAKFEKEKKALEAEAQAQVKTLKAKNQAVAKQLQDINEQLEQTSTELADTSNRLGQTEERLGQTKNQLGQTQSQLGKAQKDLAQTNQALASAQKDLGQLNAEKAALAGQIAKAKSDFEAQRGRDKAAFDAALAKEKLSGDQKAARQAAFKAEADRKARELEGKLANLGNQMKVTQGELAKAQENLLAKKKITDQIKKNFAAAGIKADVDDQTGDVILSFGDQYFDTGRSDLKPGMINIIRQAVPTYSRSLFQDPKIASKIQNVEIVGFASPTYKGKFVDPKSLDPADRAAVNYNLDLSYNRAKSIFGVIFDKNQMEFEHQKQLLPLVKVTGRSFFSNQDARGVANESHKSFCEKNDCAKLQRVIIKFNLKD
jgi:chromosome segregation ATPase